MDYIYNLDDNITALATPLGESPLAVIRISGGTSIETLASLFRPAQKLKEAKGHTLLYGRLFDEKAKELDEVTVAVYRAPRSYTGEEAVEITCHGNPFGIEAIMSALLKVGFRYASPGEFTYRAFLNGKMDLTQAEAVQEIISSKTEEARERSLLRLEGVLFRQIEDIKEKVISLSAVRELQLDYPEEELLDEVLNVPVDLDSAYEIKASLQKMLDSYKIESLYQNGIKIVLTGPVNTGKSSLFNLLMKQERSIVSSMEGTTRDFIEAPLSLKGIPVSLFDTAGIRLTDNPVEQEGIRRTDKIIDKADLVLRIIDPTTENVSEVLNSLPPSHTPVINKIDIVTSPLPKNVCAISAKTAEGLDELLELLFEKVVPKTALKRERGGITSQRQKDLIIRALEAITLFIEGEKASLSSDITAEELRSTLRALGELTGEVSGDDLRETLFSRFCVGK